MTSFPGRQAFCASCGPPPYPIWATSLALFSSREHELGMGFVAARVRLLSLLHRGWPADGELLADLLAAVPPWPARPADATPRLVRLRMQEPRTGAGMVTFPMWWEAGGSGSLQVPVLEAVLTLRVGRPGLTFLRLNGTFSVPLAAAGTHIQHAMPEAPPAMSNVDSWLARVADAMAAPLAG